MPEIEITKKQQNQILAWIEGRKYKFVDNLGKFSGHHGWVYLVDDEALMIHNYQSYYSRDSHGWIPTVESRRLYCSRRHAKVLEEAGVLRF